VAASGAFSLFRRVLRSSGWELRRTDPDRSLGEHLWFLFPYLDINCVLDVGAGDGEYGAFLRQNGYQGHIISFEPVLASFEGLARRCAHDAKWRAHRYALGSESTTAAINVTKGPSYSSFLRPTEHALATFTPSVVERTETVEVRRLDEVLDELTADIESPRVYLKLTTQGRDLDVVRGAERGLERVLALQSELSLQPVYEGAVEFCDSISQLNQAGFAVSGFFDRPHHHDFRLGEVDCVMVRPPRESAQLVRRW
jgi:FkbM family methyltransferase